MELSDFYYDLPKELIAQYPLEKRDSSRLMVLDRGRSTTTGRTFSDIVDYLEPGDCLVLNNTKVVPVRLFGRRKTGARVEIFLLNPGQKELEALVRPSKRIKDGEVVELDNGRKIVIGPVKGETRSVYPDSPIDEILASGHMPLPPYISRADEPEDTASYQTVYASRPGATAAPTAGLHFTENLIENIRQKGVEIAYVTLHTGYGTFAPVKVPRIEDHVMHYEEFELAVEAAEKINKARSSGKNVIAAGTTSVRVLETSAGSEGKVVPKRGRTNLFIYPGYKFKIVDRLITNFHLPESTLLMLVSAFAGRDFVIKAYGSAIAERYRFFSYGDAMFIA